MKNNITLALAADRTVRERWVNNHGRSVLLDMAIRRHPNAGAGLARLQANIDVTPTGDVTEIPPAPAPSTLVGRIAEETPAAHAETEEQDDERFNTNFEVQNY
jgi:hypothetical protein